MKEFLKHISIYGILPIVGKFAGFFLIPIYARVFSSYEFGIVELIVTLVSFLMFACNLEFYTAIGRFFNERDSLLKRKVLISTGLYLTLFFTAIVIILSVLSEKLIIKTYLDSGNYHFEFRIGLIWLFFSAICTYLGVIPRYDKKPKLYVLINIISLLLRIGSTIIFVLLLKTGIAGVIYGHIVGAVASFILNGIASKKYIGFLFDRKEAFTIAKFAIPIVPGLLIIGAWNPTSRFIISKYFSIKIIGLIGFATRITSILEILNYAIRLAWNPLLFENYKKPGFADDFFKISKITGLVSYFSAIFLTLTAKEIALYVGTSEYIESTVLIGFFAFRGILELLRRLRGFGPLILNKTYLLTVNEIIGIVSGLLLLFIFKDKIGLIGIGLAFLIPSFIKYVLLALYTSKNTGVKFHGWSEVLLIFLLLISILIIIFNVILSIRYTILVLILIISIYILFRENKKSIS